MRRERRSRARRGCGAGEAGRRGPHGSARCSQRQLLLRRLNRGKTGCGEARRGGSWRGEWTSPSLLAPPTGGPALQRQPDADIVLPPELGSQPDEGGRSRTGRHGKGSPGKAVATPPAANGLQKGERGECFSRRSDLLRHYTAIMRPEPERFLDVNPPVLTPPQDTREVKPSEPLRGQWAPRLGPQAAFSSIHSVNTTMRLQTV